MGKHISAILIAVILSANLFAQTETWSLNKCLEYAKENNITIKQVQLNSLTAKAQTTQAWAGLAPTVSASAGHTWNYGLSFDNSSGILQNQEYQTGFYSANANFVIFNGLSNYYRIMSAQESQHIALYDFEQAVNDVQLNVAQLYLQLLFAEERLVIVQQQVDAMQQQVDRSQLLYEAETITKGDLLAAQSQLATQQVNLANAENAVASAKISLIQGLNLDKNDIKIEKPDFSKIQVGEFEELVTLDDVYNYALDNMPVIKSKESNIIKFKRDLAIARGAYYPTLSFSANISTAFSELRKQNPFDPTSATIPYGEQLRQNNNQQLSFRISVPIFNGLDVRTNVRLAKIQFMNAELTLESERYKLKNTIQKAYTDAKAAYKTYTANQLNMSALEENYNYAQDKFSVGTITSIEFNDAANKYFNARTELLIAQYDYVLKTKVLDFYKGKKLEF